MKIDFTSNKDAVLAEIQSRIQKNVIAATEYAREKTIDKVSGIGDGKIYTIPNTNVEHQASSPGNPPAVMTGYLKNHIMSEYSDDGTLYLGYWGPQDVPYAKRLEFGFEGKDAIGRLYNQKPRPFMATTAFEEEEKLRKILRGGTTSG